METILDGCKQNGFLVDVFDKLNDNEFKKNNKYDYIIGYDFSAIKIKIDNNLSYPCIAYFADRPNSLTSGSYYAEYLKYLNNEDIYSFCWDKEFAKEFNMRYLPLFVNCEVYKNKKEPSCDIVFFGRLDTEIRLKIFLKLNKILPELSFKWYAIQKHYNDAIVRCSDDFEREIIKKSYSGFLDNSRDIACAINQSKIVYNINSQGESSLNFRTFETLACERLLISDERNDLSLFDGIIPVYKDVYDLAQKIRYYLENQDEYKKITEKSREIIKLNHDSKICVKKMMAKIRK